MSARTATLTTLAISALGTLGLLAPSASAEPAPAWQISLNAQATNFLPGTAAVGNAYPEYTVLAENVGGAATKGTIVVTVQLPSGIAPIGPARIGDGAHNIEEGGISCTTSAQGATCEDTNPIDPGDYVKMNVPVEVDDLPDPTVLNALATISGGEGASATSTVATTVSNALPPFGLLGGREGFNSSVTGEDGTAATQAGSHPQQWNVNLGLPTRFQTIGAEAKPVPDGTLRDVKADLPAGMVVDPSATQRCTQAQFQSFSCPESTQVGIAEIRRPTRRVSVSADPGCSTSRLLQGTPGPSASTFSMCQ